MDNPASRWVKNVSKAAEKSGEASGIQNSDQAMKMTEKAKSQKAKDAQGQLWGAILQNRSYDEQGKIKGSQPNHHVTDSKNHTKPLTPSEKEFVKGQAMKEKIAKKTGVYPNTAN